MRIVVSGAREQRGDLDPPFRLLVVAEAIVRSRDAQCRLVRPCDTELDRPLERRGRLLVAAGVVERVRLRHQLVGMARGRELRICRRGARHHEGERERGGSQSRAHGIGLGRGHGHGHGFIELRPTSPRTAASRTRGSLDCSS